MGSGRGPAHVNTRYDRWAGHIEAVIRPLSILLAPTWMSCTSIVAVPSLAKFPLRPSGKLSEKCSGSDALSHWLAILDDLA